MNKPDAKTNKFDSIEQSFGLRMAYVDFLKNNEVYVGALTSIAPQASDFENQDVAIKTTLAQLTLGGTIEVQKGTLVNVEGEYAKLRYGTKTAIRGELAVGDIALRAAHERMASDYVTVKPDSQKASFEAARRFPQGEIIFFGSKTDEQYAGASQSTKQFGVTMRAVIW